VIGLRPIITAKVADILKGTSGPNTVTGRHWHCAVMITDEDTVQHQYAYEEDAEYCT
jgi:hypothetical protein